MRKWLIGVTAMLALGLLANGAHAADKIRLSFNPQIYSYLPIFLALDKGYFKDQNLDIEVVTYPGSALTQIPMLARGDQDMAGMVTGPGFFNQKAAGFGIKLIASLAQAKAGWHDTNWLMVRKDIWDSGKIKTFADMKGHVVEGGPLGSPVYLNTIEAMKQGGLTMQDVTFTNHMRNVADSIPIMTNKAADFLSIVEPLAGRLQSAGLAVRWKASYEVMPWFQESYIAANPKFLADHPDVTRRFLVAYLKAIQDVTASGGKWTPELVATVVKWSKLPPEVIKAIPGPQHCGQMGKIDTASIARQQKQWTEAGLVKVQTPIAELVDTTLLDQVRKEMKID